MRPRASSWSATWNEAGAGPERSFQGSQANSDHELANSKKTLIAEVADDDTSKYSVKDRCASKMHPVRRSLVGARLTPLLLRPRIVHSASASTSRRSITVFARHRSILPPQKYHCPRHHPHTHPHHPPTPQPHGPEYSPSASETSPESALRDSAAD